MASCEMVRVYGCWYDHRPPHELVCGYYWRFKEKIAGCEIDDPTSGEGSNVPPTKSGGTSSGVGTQACPEGYALQYVPPQPATPGTPGTPGTYGQWSNDENLGWNSGARSINALPDNSYVEYKFKEFPYGVLISIGGIGMDGSHIATFEHGVMTTVSGSRVFESGAPGDSLLSAFAYGDTIRIYREDDTITYWAQRGENTPVTVVSSVAIEDTDELFVYATLYRSTDSVYCATFKNLSDEEIDGDEASNSGDGDLDGEIPALMCFMAEDDGIVHMDGYIPPITGELADQGFVPELPVSMEGSVQPITALMIMIGTQGGEMDGDIPAIDMLGGDHDYSEMTGSIPHVNGFMLWGNKLEMDLFSYMGMIGLNSMQSLQVLAFVSDMRLQSVQTLTLRKLMEVMSTITVEQQTYTMIGQYLMNAVSSVSLSDHMGIALENNPGFDEGSRVWVVNTETSASWQYDDYGFNSFLERDGEYYGVTSNGVYQLSGETDNGAEIDAVIELGSARLKSRMRVPNVYANVASDGRMIVKVQVDGGEPWYYEARSSSEELNVHRFDIGRGLLGTNWTLTLMNQDGGDFDLAGMEFLPVATNRRI